MNEPVDRELLAERAAAVVRHLDRVAEHLPSQPDLQRVHAIARAGPADLRAFLVALRDRAG